MYLRKSLRDEDYYLTDKKFFISGGRSAIVFYTYIDIYIDK